MGNTQSENPHCAALKKPVDDFVALLINHGQDEVNKALETIPVTKPPSPPVRK